MDNWKYDEDEDGAIVINDIKKTNYDKLSQENIDKINRKFNRAKSFLLNIIIAFVITVLTLDYCFLDAFAGDDWLKHFLLSLEVLVIVNFSIFLTLAVIGNILKSKFTIKGKDHFTVARDVMTVALFFSDFLIIAICFGSGIIIGATIFFCIILFIVLLICYYIYRRKGYFD